MSWPEPVSRHLQSVLQERLQPVCLLFDKKYRLREVVGDPTRFGVEGLVLGERAELLETLFGEPPAPGVEMIEFVNLGQEAFHANLVPAEEGLYLLLLPAQGEHDDRQELQQIANDVRVLNHRQKRLMDQLVEAKSELELRRHEAERANRLKSKFIASMSHEFRTPLTSVLGYAQLTAEECAHDAAAAKYAEAVERAARHLLSMVDNILDEARLEDGRVQVRRAPADVRQLADDLAAILAPLAAEKGVSFGVYVDAAVPQLLETDDMRLRQILVNLLGNSVKFTDEGEVRLEMAWGNGQLELVVIDTGPGIAQDDQKRIFNAFERVEGTDRRQGVGLGLNIVSRLIQLLEGEIEVKSALGAGTRFDVRLPAPQVARLLDAMAPAAQDGTPIETAGHRVLIAEDNPDIIRLLKIFLERAGYQLTLVGDGRQAVEAALAVEPDLVLMDVNMPVIDGLTATRQLRALGFEAPIVALTASLNADDRDLALESGCSGYISKPIHMPELLSALERILS